MDKTSTQKKFANTNNTKKNIDNVKEVPSEHIITNILNFSKALKIKKSKSMDYFEMVLN